MGQINVVHKSNRYRWTYLQPNPNDVSKIKNICKLPSPIAEIMAKKGLLEKCNIDDFFHMSLSALLNPFEILDMEKACERIIKSIMNNEKICIYGDYDVDGITSTALVYLFLKKIGADVIYYIPNRLEEGYGLNSEAITEIRSKKTGLIITVDCGISAIKEVAYAKSMNIDIIITDHHQVASNLPDAFAIVNPMRENDKYPFKTLAGVGVSFKLIMGLRHILRKKNFFKTDPPNIKNFLDIVTLGTIADVVPIIGENRIMVKQGLEIMSGNNIRVGLEELKKAAGLTNQTVKAFHVGFQLAPRLNAVGRMGNSDKSLQLLITENRQVAKTLSLELDSENKFRQTIERDILQETFQIIEKNKLYKNASIVLSGENWHPGVIGIVASRVVDKYFRPTIILSSDGDTAKGSARSIPSFHLYNGLEEISDILLTFGGHKYAAGVKIEANRINELKEKFNDTVASKLTRDDFIPIINIDAIIEVSDINADTIGWLSKMEPFGPGNKEPIFCLKNVAKYQPATLVGKEAGHLKCYFEKNGTILDSIGYNMKEYRDIINSNNYFDILFTITSNYWKGNLNIQLNLKDLKAVN